MEVTAEQLEIASRTPKEAIPPKLRCGSCDRWILNAYKLLCCEEGICEACYQSKPNACPVCFHEPFNFDECKVYKAKRMTLKAYLKNEESKLRNNERQKTTAEGAAAKTTPATVVESNGAIDQVEDSAATTQPSLTPTTDQQVPPPTITNDAAPVDLNSQVGKQDTKIDAQGADLGSPPGSPDGVEFILKYDKDHPNAWINDVGHTFGTLRRRPQSVSERPTSRRSSNSDKGARHTPAPQPNNAVAQQQNRMKEQTHTSTNDSSSTGHGRSHNTTNSNSFNNSGGFNSTSSMQGGVSPAMWSNFQQMQMQMMMNGGMPAMMQSMGMDPMSMSPGMFGGFEGQGMQGMNMNMNMNMGFNGGYPAWNMGSGGAGFGANAGFHSQGGYNQQSHQGPMNNMPRSQFNRNYNQNRFRGQQGNRRGYGRDQQNFGQRSGSQMPQAYAGRPQQDEHHLAQASNERPTAERITNGEEASSTNNMASTTVDNYLETNETQHAPSANVEQNNDVASKDGTANHAIEHPQWQTALDSMDQQDQVPEQAIAQGAETAFADDSVVAPVDANAVEDPAFEQDFAGRGRVDSFGSGRPAIASRGPHRGRGPMRQYGRATDSIELTSSANDAEVQGTGVTGAPTGPKAMRDGLPNVGFRARGGMHVAGRSVSKPATPTTASMPPAAPSSVSMDERPPKDNRLSRSRSPEISYRSGGYRTRSVSPDVEDRESRRERRHRHSRHHSRGPADESVNNSEHRSRHDREKHRSSRKDRDDRDTSRDRHRRKHRSRSPEKANGRADPSDIRADSRRDSKYRDRENDRKEDRRRSRYDGEDDRHRHRSSRSERKDREDRKDLDKKTLSAPATREFEIKGSSTRKQTEPPSEKKPPQGPSKPDRSQLASVEVQKEIMQAKNPSIDPYALEREAQKKARLVAEEQRRQSLTGAPPSNSRKRTSAAMEMGPPSSPALANGDADSSRHSRKRQRHDDGRGSKSRRTSYKYEDDEDSDARALRVERDREAARFR